MPALPTRTDPSRNTNHQPAAAGSVGALPRRGLSDPADGEPDRPGWPRKKRLSAPVQPAAVHCRLPSFSDAWLDPRPLPIPFARVSLWRRPLGAPLGIPTGSGRSSTELPGAHGPGECVPFLGRRIRRSPAIGGPARSWGRGCSSPTPSEGPETTSRWRAPSVASRWRNRSLIRGAESLEDLRTTVRR